MLAQFLYLCVYGCTLKGLPLDGESIDTDPAETESGEFSHEAVIDLKAKMSALGEWYRCRGLAVVANSGVSTVGFNQIYLVLQAMNKVRG